MDGEKEPIYLFGTIFLCSSIALQSPWSRDSRGWIALWANQHLPHWAGCCSSPWPSSLPRQKILLLPLFVAAYIRILISLIPEKIDLIWGNCYVAAKMKLLLFVCGYLVLYPKSAKEKSMSFYISWYKNAHLHKITQYTHPATQSSHCPERRFNEKVRLKIKIRTSTADGVDDSWAVSSSPLYFQLYEKHQIRLSYFPHLSHAYLRCIMLNNCPVMQPQPLFVLYENKSIFSTGFYDASLVYKKGTTQK